MGGHVYPIDSEFSCDPYTDHCTRTCDAGYTADARDFSTAQYSFPTTCPTTELYYSHEDSTKVQLHIPTFRPTRGSCLFVKVKTESDQEKSEPFKVKSETFKVKSEPFKVKSEPFKVKSESDRVNSESVKLESEQSYMTKPDFNYSLASCRFDKNLCRRSNASLPFAYSNSYNEIKQSEDTQNCFESKHTFSKYDGSTNMHDRSDTTNTHLIRHVTDFDPYYSVTVQNIQRSYDQYPFLHEQDIKRTRSYASSDAPNNYEEVPMNYSNVDYQCSNTCFDQTYTSHFTSSSCYYSDMQYSTDVTQATNEKSFRASDWPTETLNYRPHAQVHSTSGYRPCIKKLKRGCRLWEFIRNLLLDPTSNPSLIRWENRAEGMFKLVQSKTIAYMWGMKKGNRGMTYEKLSRAMRYYLSLVLRKPVFGVPD